MKDKVAKGRQSRLRGSFNGMAKLSDVQVLNLRADRAAGMKSPALAKKYSVGTSTVSRIIHGKRWTGT